MVADGLFKNDLYQRICDLPYKIPPLRDRTYDIPPLINHFIEVYCEEFKMNPQQKLKGVTEDCLDLLMNYKWAGNVRELKKLIKIIVFRRKISKNNQDIEFSDLPQDFLDTIDSAEPASKQRKGRKKRPSDEELIRLEKEGWSRKEVAEKFGVVPRTASCWYTDIRKNEELKNQS
jgi:transcriptional regulator with PAS, ATPase and Fis domain